MYYGHPKHIPSPDDLTIIKCRACGWVSPEMNKQQKADRGYPWYCDSCGEKVTHFIRFHPDERPRAYYHIR